VTAIQEVKDLDKLRLKTMISSLKSHKMNLKFRRASFQMFYTMFQHHTQT